MMVKKIGLVFICVLFGLQSQAQELNCNVTIISPSIQMSNKRIFNSLQQSIWQFMNATKWTSNKYENGEKIECNLQIEITGASTDQFTAKVQMNSLRPVYGSGYKTILFNHLDQDWVFNYVEFQQLNFQENTGGTNLSGFLAFYAYMMIGFDYDSYSLEGGSPYFTVAQNIASLNQNSPGWEPTAGSSSVKNRYYLIENVMNARYKPMRKMYYQYHRLGLDIMHKTPDDGREAITKAIKLMEPVADILPNAMFIKVFFNSKVNELVNIYKGAPASDQNKMIELLSKLDPGNKPKYDKIKEK
jgi:hypothetical protein